MLTILLVYLIGKHVYGRRVGILAATFSALAVLQIQLSHYFTMDTFTTFFSVLTVYFAVRVAINPKEELESNRGTNTSSDEEDVESKEDVVDPHLVDNSGQTMTASSKSRNLKSGVKRIVFDPIFLFSIGFGVSLGMAAASKINAAPLAFLLPGAMLIRLTCFRIGSHIVGKDRDPWTCSSIW